jgi:hypothetical protein
MINSSYTLEQSVQMLNILGRRQVMLSSYPSWPEDVVKKYGECDFFFNSNKIVVMRCVRNGIIQWRGPIPLNDFWERKISQSLSFQCAKHMRIVSKKTGIKEISHLLCKFHNFNYIPPSILI